MWLGLCFLFVIGAPHASAQAIPDRSGSEADFPPPNWRPNQGSFSVTDYVGPKVCAKCHAAEAKSELGTSMGHAAEAASDCRILHQHRQLEFRLGNYHYEIHCQKSRCDYLVTDGHSSISTPILWAFGQGEAGQTYILKWRGSYYQSRVSFFNDTQGLDVTLGVPRGVPSTLENALGAPMSQVETPLCFGCHTTGGVSQGRIDAERLIPGVTCEACHGPGAQHVKAMRAGQFEKTHIFNPGTLGADDLADFCGACHRTSLAVQLMGIRGVRNVRFQPYRLENARCWNSEDVRISCLACHDPHQQVSTNSASYDAKCQACHSGKAQASPSSKPAGRACPVAARNCVSCHMPRYALPGGHFKFTDHWIRVVKRGENYPS